MVLVLFFISLFDPTYNLTLQMQFKLSLRKEREKAQKYVLFAITNYLIGFSTLFTLT